MRISATVKEETRAALVREGARLFSEQGFTETTIEQVTAAAGTAKGTFYNYFKTKEDLAVAVVLTLQEASLPALQAVAAGPDPIAQRLHALYAARAGWVQSSPELTMVWVVERLLHGRISGPSPFSRILAQALMLAQERSEVRQDRPAALMAAELEGIFLSYIAIWYHADRTMDLARAIVSAIDTYLEGARPRANGGEHA